MLLLAKVGLGFTAGLAVAGGYVCHQGVLRVDQDDLHGSHLHLWIPSVAVPVALHLVPKHKLEEAAAQAGPWQPALRTFTKELEKYPDVELVDVRDSRDHVSIRVQNGKLFISADEPGNRVRVSCPLELLQSVSAALESNAPAI